MWLLVAAPGEVHPRVVMVVDTVAVVAVVVVVAGVGFAHLLPRLHTAGFVCAVSQH